MTPAQLETVEGIFHAALDQEPDDLGAFLKTACKGDELLRGKVEALIASHQRAGSFIEMSVASLGARIVEQRQADLLIAQTIGHYKILERIGTGGMGEVYLASDLTAGRKAALKLLPKRFTGDAERLKRFQQEARAVVGLNHPNILTVYEIGEDHSTHYIASELIEGETLRQRLTRGRMQLSEVVDVAIQVTRALAAAHETGIVHRDIKPENIMLRPDGYVKVLDFGIAKLAEQEVPVTTAEEEAVLLVETNLGSILGTVRYMSPEQARGAPVDKCTDIWSLGVVLYEMAAGRAPFNGDTPREVMASILGTEPPPLPSSIAQTPAELQQIASKALSKEQERRYQSAHELLEALKNLRHGMEFKAELERSTAAPSWRRWTRSPAAALLVLLGAALALPFYWHRNPTRTSIPEKSIAVLPFENFSDNKENSELVAGIQDDVLTSLAQIHDLKVISRTSVMAYQKPGGRNMREIGRALGVAHVLEGSVRRTGNRMLVNVQLIDARNDRHIWADRYDRTVADSIGLQGELARQIAVALKAALAPEEEARLKAKPTENAHAYLLYLKARELERGVDSTLEDQIAAEAIYGQAIALDPAFALAHAQASIANSSIFLQSHEQTRKSKARAEAEEALRLAPTLGEAHLALGICLYLTEKDYEAALKQFAIAEKTSPNNQSFSHSAAIYRRQGRWREASASFERAEELDPLNERLRLSGPYNLLLMRDWTGATAAYKRMLEIWPASVIPKIELAYLEVRNGGNPAVAKAMLPKEAGAERTVASWDLSMLERDFVTAATIMNRFPSEQLWPGFEMAPKSLYQARTALASGDVGLAQRLFEKPKLILEAEVRDHPDDARRHAALGLLYAYMGRKDDAIREGRRAVELEPESQDAYHGALMASYLALVYARTGEVDQAITLIERLLSTPGPVEFASEASITLAELRLRWEWDPLRTNPRFQKILADPEPKTVY